MVYDDLPPERPLVLLDGLLGIGADGELRGAVRDACVQMNRLRETAHAATVAIDIPTGLDANTGEPDADAVIADLTATIAHPKCGLVADAAINHVGRIAVVPLEDLPAEAGNPRSRILVASQLRLPSRRKFDTHKGDAGRVGIVAGSKGMLGAGRLASAAAVKGGAGLVTWFVPKKLYNIAAASAGPEVMVVPIKSLDDVREAKLDALAVGPGLGKTDDELIDLVLADPRPAVIDADALNKIARFGIETLRSVSVPRLLTPHPGEMARLVESWDVAESDRSTLATAFTDAFPVALLLKGARTVIKAAAEPLSYNSTGTPGMATGGMGDVLSGLTASLLAGGLSPYEAGCTGSWLLGRAAELAIRDHRESAESLSPTEVIRSLGSAFRALREEG